MKRFNKIAIIGVGLIGGSIGLAVKRRKLAKEVIGIFRHASTMKRALKSGAIDKGTMDIEEGVEGADLVIIATPVGSIPKLVAKIIKHAQKGMIITDVGSTKRWVVDTIERYLAGYRSVFFVGSHPMAGSEHTGVEFAKPDLLKGSPCIVTKTRKTDKGALGKVRDFWASLGLEVDVMDPTSHDRIVAFISHLPHIVAFSIAGVVAPKDLVYAAEGFKDTTRVASSDPKMWTDIFFTNKEEVSRSDRAFQEYCTDILKNLTKRNYPNALKLLKNAKAKRDKFFYGG